MDSDTAAIGLGAATAGSLLTGLGAWIVNLMKTRHDQDRQVRKDTIEELYRLNEQLRKDLDNLEKKYDAVIKEHVDCQLKYTRLLERMDNYERLLTDAKIPFRPFQSGGSNNHPALPQEGK